MNETSKQSKGGANRAKSLTKEERKKIASEAAKTRWASESSLPKAEYMGELVIGDLRIPCAVLEDGRRVISEHGITTALGSRSGASKRLKKSTGEAGTPLPIFLAPPRLSPYIPDELLSGPLCAITYRTGTRKIIGYAAEALPKICDVWLKAREDGVLQRQQFGRAQKAEILMRGLAHVGIIALVDEATGYQQVRDRQALHKILEEFIAKELQPWTKTFPDEFYEHLFRLRGWQYKPLSTSRPGAVAQYTVNLVYERLAPGVIDELKNRAAKGENGKRKHRLHQHLTADIGHPKLKELISNVLVLQRVNDNWDDFIKMMDKALPRYSDGKQLRLFTKPTGDGGE